MLNYFLIISSSYKCPCLITIYSIHFTEINESSHFGPLHETMSLSHMTSKSHHGTQKRQQKLVHTKQSTRHWKGEGLPWRATAGVLVTSAVLTVFRARVLARGPPKRAVTPGEPVPPSRMHSPTFGVNREVKHTRASNNNDSRDLNCVNCNETTITYPLLQTPVVWSHVQYSQLTEQGFSHVGPQNFPSSPRMG